MEWCKEPIISSPSLKMGHLFDSRMSGARLTPKRRSRKQCIQTESTTVLFLFFFFPSLTFSPQSLILYLIFFYFHPHSFSFSLSYSLFLLCVIYLEAVDNYGFSELPVLCISNQRLTFYLVSALPSIENKLVMYVIHCYSFKSRLKYFPVSAKYSKPSFLIIGTRNSSFFFLVLS